MIKKFMSCGFKDFKLRSSGGSGDGDDWRNMGGNGFGASIWGELDGSGNGLEYEMGWDDGSDMPPSDEGMFFISFDFYQFFILNFKDQA